HPHHTPAHPPPPPLFQLTPPPKYKGGGGGGESPAPKAQVTARSRVVGPHFSGTKRLRATFGPSSGQLRAACGLCGSRF
ncbi:hypothetical protein, partial [Nocardia abscessus]|uniref:hypothetical protein n=1 Tax=Nocardia abscessus TaxID=120957 RepID=UPI00245667F9